MNKIYKVIWDPILNINIVAGEFSRSKGKKSSKSALVGGLLGAVALSFSPVESAQAYTAGGGATPDADGVAIGTNTTAGAAATVPGGAIGTGNTDINGTKVSSVSIGETATSDSGSVAIGDHANALNTGTSTGISVAIGPYSSATKGGSIAVGAAALANGQNSVALGIGTETSVDGDVAIGSSAYAGDGGKGNTAVGNWSKAVSGSAAAFGDLSNALAAKSTAVGYKSTATAEDSLAMGSQSIAAAANAVAAGLKSSANATDAVALGANSVASVVGSVALGANSVTSNAIATESATINGKTYHFAGTTPYSTVSVGGKGSERTVSNVAAGRVSSTSTDAVNGSQLNATNLALNSLSDTSVQYDADKDGNLNLNSITLKGTTYNSQNGSGGTTITNVARGVNDSDAVNMSQLNDVNSGIADINTTITNLAGNTDTTYIETHGSGTRYSRTNETGLAESDSTASGKGSTAVGYNATSAGENSLALGNAATATNTGDVALGAGSTTAAAVATTSATIKGATYNFAGTAPVSTVSVGSAGKERTITNVAAGRLSATSTDAVNGSQLNATNLALNSLSDTSVQYDADKDGNLNLNSITLKGTTYNSQNGSGGTTITNVARGVNDSDAVNMSQLNDVNGDIADINTTITNLAGNTDTTYIDAHGSGTRYTRTNATGLAESDSTASGKGSTAVGYNATSAGENSLALGNAATATNAGDVALGAGSTTAAAVATTSAVINGVTYNFAGTAPVSTVSVGSAGKERTITNVAAGRLSATSTDAVNGSQLYATNTAVSNLTQSTIQYNTNTDGSTNYDSIVLNGDTYNSNTKEGGTTISNVAYGVNDSDAVNVQQLNEATSNIYNSGVKYFHSTSELADAVASGADSVAVGPQASAKGASSIAMGNNAESVGANSTAIGAGAKATNANDVALGSNSVTEAAVATTGVTIRGQEYSFAGTAPTSTVSVGSAGNERTITNVAAGRISATSTDAVNGSQLYATNQAIENITASVSDISASAVQYNTLADGSVDYNTLVLGGDTYGNATNTGGTTIANVANGVNASDAVNKYQLDQVSESVVTLAEGKAGMFQVNNTSNLATPVLTGADTTAVGAGTNVSGNSSVAVGSGSTASHNNAVALGANSSTDRDNSVSVGSAGNERQITNVAAGTKSTDAVNVAQMKDAVSDSYQYTNNKFGDLKNMINDQKDKLSAGIAGAMAMAGLPQPYSAGASMFSMSGGTYQGESAVAFGVSTISDNGKWVSKLSGSTNSQGDYGAAIGVGYQW
ncbi:YadA family autotransporter adhesin [Enterobacter sp. KB-221C9]|uniref:YadA family autotransporter adhesin n=1 Tax=Enterobacter sp. KB-221C9 TaxID=3242496 RepID=UPI003520FBB4